MRAVFGVEDRAAMARLRRAAQALRRLGRRTRARWSWSRCWASSTRSCAGSAPALPGPVDRELYALIAERRAAPDLAERDDVLSMLLLARDEQGEPMTDVELRDELHDAADRPVTRRRRPRWPGRSSASCAIPAAWSASRATRPTSTRWSRRRCACARSSPLVLRQLLEPLEIGGHELPAGTTVAPVILLVHRREDVYPEPEAFRPERFLDRPPGTYSWIPFGGGVRRCLGAAFAQVEMQTVLQTLAESVALEAGRRAAKRPYAGAASTPRSRRAAAQVRALAAR